MSYGRKRNDIYARVVKSCDIFKTICLGKGYVPRHREYKVQPFKIIVIRTYLLACLLAYLLIPCSTALLKKLTVPHQFKNSSVFYGTQYSITVHTSAHYFQSTPIFILILSSQLFVSFSSDIFLTGIPIRTKPALLFCTSCPCLPHLL